MNAEPDESVLQELTVTFSPPLFQQRRIWVLDVLRREGVTSLLDVGCGQGLLLSCLSQPAAWLEPTPIHLDSDSKTADASNAPDRSYTLGLSHTYHPTRLVGLDLAWDDLQYAVDDTTPQSEQFYGYGRLRWEPLEVKIWQGGLECVNEAFVDTECITAMEVIEHLPEDILQLFAPVLLGVYHPRLLLLTTPSYTYNARFSAPFIVESSDRPSGYPDPTGRTDRVFRHSDHKFEWTVEEFTTWCERTANEWGYDVQISGVGKALEKDPWGRDDALGYASQVAAFKRKEGGNWETERAARCAGVLRRQEQCRHTLLANHQHLAHSQAGRPAPLLEIGEAIKLRLLELREANLGVLQLWHEDDLAVLCGGRIEMLVRAVEEHEQLNLLNPSGSQSVDSWDVELIGGLQDKKGYSYWPEEEEEAVEGESVPTAGNCGWGSHAGDMTESWPSTTDRDEEVTKSYGWGTGVRNPDGQGGWSDCKGPSNVARTSSLDETWGTIDEKAESLDWTSGMGWGGVVGVAGAATNTSGSC